MKTLKYKNIEGTSLKRITITKFLDFEAKLLNKFCGFTQVKPKNFEIILTEIWKLQ
tara:strand:+ start:384 stop:551 length:168 start_codon:yes stop_codon:yes gene_type:complete